MILRTVMFRRVVRMDIKCRKNLQPGVPCRSGPPSPSLTDIVGLTSASPNPSFDTASPSGIAFDAASGVGHLAGSIRIPGYDAPTLPVKPVRDPSLSLVALSGINPSRPIMVAVPLVQNNTAFTAGRRVNGLRVGVAGRYARGDDHERIEHRACFTRALEALRLAGVELVQVPARRTDGTLKFSLYTHNEIDALVTQYRLDALVSDSQSAAFHEACRAGFPRLGEPLGDGSTLWFYGTRLSKNLLLTLRQGYRSARRLMDLEDGLPGVLKNPTS